MTTYVPFTPTPGAPFQFQATLDGSLYNVIVNWNVTGTQTFPRWYANVYDTSNTLIVCIALIPSPAAVAIQSITWLNGVVTATTTTPHGYTLYSTTYLNMQSSVPTQYAGSVLAFITSPTTFTYSLPAYPGAATTLGVVSYDISMVAGYFNSTLVFRESTQTFEISP